MIFFNPTMLPSKHRRLFARVFQGEDGDFLWDEQVFLMVDNLEQQQLLVQLQERHTWHDDRAFAHQAILGKKREQQGW